jgi:hypothetical protein
MTGILKHQKTIDGGGWFINNIPLHTDDIDRFVNYNENSELIYDYENKEVEYHVEEYNHSFYGKYDVVRILV